MTRKSNFGLVVCVLVSLLALARPSAAAEAIALSDIHFNPLADKTLAAELDAAPPQRWAAILDRGSEVMSRYGEDTDWKLLKAALAALKAQPKPDFVLIPGDFLVHEFRARYEASLPHHSAAGFNALALKTFAFLSLQLQATFPDTPILPTLGNNDSDCGDYGVQPGGPLLAGSLDIVARLIGKDARDPIAASWTALGNYAAPVAAVPGLSIIAINSNYFAPKYRNACGNAGDGDPARATLAWLEAELARAAAAHRQVILLYHIPPGIDAFASAKRASCPATPATMFTPATQAALHTLLARYRDTIAGSIAGHLHTDAFRLIRDGDAPPVGFVMIVPGLSPIFGQNPAFRRLRFGAGGTIADETTYYLGNLVDAATGIAPQWRAEASFDTAWGASRFDGASLDALVQRLGISQDARDRWTAEYGVQGPQAIAVAMQNFAAYRCSVAYDQPADAARCLCSGSR